MKVLIINGSPRSGGNTEVALAEMKKVFDAEGVEYEVVNAGAQPIGGCMACNACKSIGKCVMKDLVNETAPKFAEADGVVIASPVYFASANGNLISFLDRLFYSTSFDKAMKVGCAVTVCRRGGNTSTFDELNKYFTISEMPVVSSRYWNMVHGMMPGEAKQDEEGLATMRQLAKNMVFLMKSIALGKEQFGMPEKEAGAMTNFIR